MGFVNTPWRKEGKERLSLWVRGRGAEGKKSARRGIVHGCRRDGRLAEVLDFDRPPKETLQHLTTGRLQHPLQHHYSIHHGLR